MSNSSQVRAQSLEEFPNLTWEELQQKLLLSPHDRPSTSNSIELLLSASSYPAPETSIQSSDQTQEAPLYGGFLIETPWSQDKIDQSIQPNSPLLKKRGRPGRPRKDAADAISDDPEERRRLQIRLAQRAYRLRREKNLLRYKNRITQLETAVEEMSAPVLSLSQQLVQSGALASNPGLASHLHETVFTCLRSVKEARPDGELEMPDAFPSEEPSSSPSTQEEINPIQSWVVELIARSQLTPSQPPGTNPTSSQENPISSSPYTPGSTEIPDMELPAFIERLHIACLSQGYLALRDSSISIDRLRKPFRLLLTSMNRDRITSYFEAALHSRLSKQRLHGWKDVPFFSLGGAGTHALPSSSRGLHPQQWITVHDPLAQHPPEVQEELDGEWFTLQDLEVFLRQKGVRKFACAPPEMESRPSSPARVAINVARLMHALISRCICLGRSPGFRRCDVERALRASVLT